MNPSPRGKYMDPFAYLDRLPLHPQPEPLESFSSYLLRLTEANEHRRYSDLSHLFSIPTSTFFQIADYPLRSFGVLPKRTGCSLDRLLATTLFHVAKKFRRSTLPLFFARFFAGSLGNFLRYCPACLKEAPYYSLLWRFLALPGCDTHQLRLLEQCGHCGSQIPLSLACQCTRASAPPVTVSCVNAQLSNFLRRKCTSPHVDLLIWPFWWLRMPAKINLTWQKPLGSVGQRFGTPGSALPRRLLIASASH